jgi:hypothetical protein
MSFQAYLDKVEQLTGKTPREFIAEARAKNLTEFKDLMAWLKNDYGLGTGHAIDHLRNPAWGRVRIEADHRNAPHDRERLSGGDCKSGGGEREAEINALPDFISIVDCKLCREIPPMHRGPSIPDTRERLAAIAV